MSPASSEGSELLEVGYIGKANGLAGGVVVTLVTDRVQERTAPGARLFAETEWLEISSARPHKDRWVMTFAGLTSREDIEPLRGRVLTAEPIDDPDELFVHALIGCSVHDVDGNDHGEVVSVVANPASDLLELASGKLVPLAFYVSHDQSTIVVDVPAGLLDDEAVVVDRND